MDNNGMPATHDEVRGGTGSKIWALVAAVVMLLGANVYLFSRMSSLETGTAQWKSAMSRQVSEFRDAVSTSDAAHAKNVEVLRTDLEVARHQAELIAGHANRAAQKHADQLAKELDDAQQQQQRQVASELTEIKQGAATTNTKIADVSSDVAATKSDVAATKSDLQNTVSELKRVTGDMGVLSDRIATNGGELSALRALGERNYFEFDIPKSNVAQKVANVQLLVKRIDPKRNRFTIEIQADDKTVEKRDRTINEPVQFYVSKARQPYEIVVNEVTKNHIVGYLATPRVEMARK